MFARWGRFVYRFRWATLVVSALLLGLSIAAILTGGTLAGNGGFGADLPAGKAAKLIGDEVHPQGGPTTASSTFSLIFSSTNKTVDDPAFQQALQNAVTPLSSDSRVTSVTTPYSVPPAARSALVSRDLHKALVVVALKDDSQKAQSYLNQVVGEVHPGSLSFVATGQVPINLAFKGTLEADLNQAELVALPVTLLLLVLIFASIVAALLPVGVGLFAIAGGVGGTLFLAHFTDVSQYAMNVVTLIGLAVAIGLSAMLFYQGTFLASMGAGGAIVVAMAVLYGLTFLPALLSLLGKRVDRLGLPFLGASKPAGTGAWHSMAMWVMRRPVLVLIPSLILLVLAGTPFLQLRLAQGGVDQLPPSNLARQGYDTLVKDFPGQDQTTIEAVVYYPDSSPLTSDHIGDIYDLSRRLGSLTNVLRVESVVNADPSLTKADYQRLLSGPRQSLPAATQQALSVDTGSHIARLYLVTNQPPTGDEARTIVRAVRAEQVAGGQVLATGETAFDLDVVNFILGRTPTAVGTVILITYIVLFLLTGSVILPLKAVLTNLFSISASFGAMVWIFQEGHLSQLLGFSAQAIDPSLPVILFSIVFGMSMDYEVLLISRIQEEYRLNGDNQAAVAMGLEKSGRLITGAALIMVAVFLAFGLASVVIIKAIGIALAIAVAIDATIVRILIVPSVMRLLGRANWWAPRPLALLHRRIGAGESHGPAPASVIS